MKAHILAKLNELRAKADKSYEDVHEELGFATSTVRRWHLGRNNPDLDQLTALVEYYGGNMFELFADVGKQEMAAAQESGYLGVAAMTESYEAQLKAKDEQIEYLNNEVTWLRGVVDALARRGDHHDLP